MAELVASALVQEGIAGAVSYVLGRKRKLDAAAGGRPHAAERQEMALSRLWLALERSAKLPVTDVSLLHRRKALQRAYHEATALLASTRRHQQQQDDADAGRLPPSSSFLFPKRWIARASSFFSATPSLLGSTGPGSDAGRLEWLADCADAFVRDVESGCTLRHHTWCSPLARHLLLGRKTLWFRPPPRGSRRRGCVVWPVCLEGRGVEAIMLYVYEDRERPQASFVLALALRLSESTDVVGTAVRCLRSVASRCRLDAALAIGELTLLASSSQDMSRSDGPPLAGIQEHHAMKTRLIRPDPVCCTSDNGPAPDGAAAPSSELSRILPEQVVFFGQVFYIPASAPDHPDEAANEDDVDGDGMRDWPHLKLITSFLPHHPSDGLWASHGDKDNGSVQRMLEMARSKAIEFVRQPELRNCRMHWTSSDKHGVTELVVENPFHIHHKHRGIGGDGVMDSVTNLSSKPRTLVNQIKQLCRRVMPNDVRSEA